jgi:hypothetical protein
MQDSNFFNATLTSHSPQKANATLRLGASLHSCTL